MKMVSPGDSASRGVALLSPVRGTNLLAHTVRSPLFPPGFALGPLGQEKRSQWCTDPPHLPVQCGLAALPSTAAPSDGTCFPAPARAWPFKSGSPQWLWGPGYLSPRHPYPGPHPGGQPSLKPPPVNSICGRALHYTAGDSDNGSDTLSGL